MSETRDSIVKAVESSLSTLRSVEQKLNEAVIEEDVYTRALNMVISIKFESRYKNPALFQLLLSRGRELNQNKDLSNAHQVLKTWQNGLKELLRYPMDLYLAPNRPELKSVKLTTGYFEYQINRRLTNAKEFLHEMGYEPRSRSPSEYVLKNTSNLVATIADLVILHQDLEAAFYVMEVVRNTCQSKSVSGRLILLTDVLASRHFSIDPSINGCVHYLMCDLSPPNLPTQRNTVDPPRSLTTNNVVANDGHIIPPKIKPRKNNTSGLISRGSDFTPPINNPESSITSIPPDPSQLPPPVMTHSELMRMLGTTPEGDSSQRNVSHDSQSVADVDSQIYRPFADGGYTSVLFSIGGYDGESKGLPSTAIPTNTYSSAHDNNLLQSSLHRRSSEGSLLDQNPVRSNNAGTYYSPPVSQRYAPHTSNQPHLPPSSGYPVTSNTGRNQWAGERYANQGNMPPPPANMQYSRYNSRDHHLKTHPPQTNSSTWGGESPRQYLKQISEKEHNDSSLKAMDLAMDPSTPRPWQCHQCTTKNGSDLVGCPKCGELAPFIDTDGTPPALVPQHTATPRHIETDCGDTWVCYYCYVRNNSPKGSRCKQCQESRPN